MTLERAMAVAEPSASPSSRPAGEPATALTASPSSRPAGEPTTALVPLLRSRYPVGFARARRAGLREGVRTAGLLVVVLGLVTATLAGMFSAGTQLGRLAGW